MLREQSCPESAPSSLPVISLIAIPPPLPPRGDPTPGVSGSEKVVKSQTQEGTNQKQQFWEASGVKGRRRSAEALTRVLAPSARRQISQISPSRLRRLPDAAQGDCTFPGTPPLFLTVN